MSGQRARSSVAADHRSVHPNIAGIPWWGAVLSAVIASAIGFAFDAGSGGGQLTAAFAALYVIGCLIAVLAVQQSALFTAVIQPPLVLFVTVPGAYFLMHASEIQGIKDILINCGYPLIERFPLMFFTSAAVLLIGLGRWYFGKAARTADSEPDSGRGRGLTSKVSSLLGGTAGNAGTDTDEAEQPRERRATDRRRKTKPAARDADRAARRASRSRHTRPPDTEIVDPVGERPRRRPRPDEPSEPRRRPRPSDRERREPREPRERRPREERYGRDAYDERPPRERAPRRARYDDNGRYDSGRYDDGRRDSGRYDDREPFDPYGSSGSGTHHPISRVRYRGDDAGDSGRSGDRAEYRTRRRPARDVDRWEYDV